MAECVARVCPPMMGDIGEEITEIELEPLPEAPGTEAPGTGAPPDVPVEPATEPVPG